jgi:hypothetical protein
MEWYEHIKDSYGLEIGIFGEDKLMRINFMKYGDEEHELVVSLDDYRVVAHSYRVKDNYMERMTVSTPPEKFM